MYLRSSGKPSKVPMRLCKQATRFFGRRLLGENLYHKLEITLRFETFKKNSNEYAYYHSNQFTNSVPNYHTDEYPNERTN